MNEITRDIKQCGCEIKIHNGWEGGSVVNRKMCEKHKKLLKEMIDGLINLERIHDRMMDESNGLQEIMNELEEKIEVLEGSRFDKYNIYN